MSGQKIIVDHRAPIEVPILNSAVGCIRSNCVAKHASQWLFATHAKFNRERHSPGGLQLNDAASAAADRKELWEGLRVARLRSKAAGITEAAYRA